MLRASLFVAAILASGCAAQSDQTTAASDRECFQSSSVSGFNSIDSRHVRISVGASRAYILTTLWDTHTLNWSEAIALHATNGMICTGNGLGVEIVGGEPSQRYPISSIERAPDDAPQGS